MNIPHFYITGSEIGPRAEAYGEEGRTLASVNSQLLEDCPKAES